MRQRGNTEVQPSDYFVSVCDINKVFYTAWAKQKTRLHGLLQVKSKFLAFTRRHLHSINKEIEKSASNIIATTPDTYYYASTTTAIHFNSASSSSKPTVAYALKIYSVEIFQLCFQPYSNKEMLAYFSEKVFDKKRIEKCLDTLQLKQGLSDVA